MTPIFTTHGSMGKSILTYEKPHEEPFPLAPDSIFDICAEENLKHIVVLEDSFLSFRKINKYCIEKDIELCFGIKFNCVQESFEEKTTKFNIFAKNSNGIIKLRQIYNKTYLENSDLKTSGTLKVCDLKADPDLNYSVPFYDSFLFYNKFHFNNSVFSNLALRPVFFIERNNHPFDSLLERTVNEYCQNNNFDTCLVKSIFYKNRKDFIFYQGYKSMCNRYTGKKSVVSNPNLEHSASDEFCWESFKDHVNNAR